MNEWLDILGGDEALATMAKDTLQIGEPHALAELNYHVAPYGAVFSHAYRFNEASGNAIDLAPTGGINLVSTGTVTREVVTGLPGQDRGISFATGGNAMEGGATSDFNVTTGSLVLYLRTRIPSTPASIYGIAGKGQSNYWLMRINTSGQILVVCTDGTLGPGLTIASDHTGTGYVDLLWVIDRTSATKLMSLNSNIADGGTVSITSLGSLTSGNKFGLGQIAGIVSGVGQTVTFLALGTVPGTLTTDRVAALAALRNRMWG